MEESLRLKTPPASLDLATTERFTNELTQTNLDSSSLTVKNSKESFHRSANARPAKCTAWTDEKHNLYLGQLEASFVKQLHCSMGLLAWRSEQNTSDQNSSLKLPANTRNTSEQFTFLQNGYRQKINFERNQPPLDIAADSHVVLKSPWIRHFRCAGKSHTMTFADLQPYSTLSSPGMHLTGKRAFSHRLTTTSEQITVNHQCHQDASGCITEVSDQNFVDEDQEEKSSSLSMAKRLKTTVANASSEDQLVPSGKFRKTEISTRRNTSSEREERVRQEWLSDVKSILRKS